MMGIIGNSVFLLDYFFFVEGGMVIVLGFVVFFKYVWKCYCFSLVFVVIVVS